MAEAHVGPYLEKFRLVIVSGLLTRVKIRSLCTCLIGNRSCPIGYLQTTAQLQLDYGKHHLLAEVFLGVGVTDP